MVCRHLDLRGRRKARAVAAKRQCRAEFPEREYPSRIPWLSKECRMMHPVKLVTLAAILGLWSGAVFAQSSSTDSMSSNHSGSMSSGHSSDPMSGGNSDSMSNGHCSDSMSSGHSSDSMSSAHSNSMSNGHCSDSMSSGHSSHSMSSSHSSDSTSTQSH
jgi:hypothetical protein